ncbi:MAG: hypothetical protein HKN44_10465, partial [Ilumatobacter sp.]|nr:hypothetical protein [Ilumatobacter sp.]
MITISRRRFLALTGGLLATGCTATRATTAPDAGPGSTGTGSTTVAPTVAPTTTGVVTTIATPPETAPDDRVLVLVELRGGNDAVNTLPPLTGAYRDMRPTIALPEADVVLVDAFADHGLHPSLAPLVPFADNGRLAALAGIGFPDPDRSHFVSMDRWARADRLDEQAGWLGRWLDSLQVDPTALGATSLGSRGDVLVGEVRNPTVIDEVDAFAFPAGLSNSSIRLLGDPAGDDPLLAAAQRAFVDSVGAIEEFDAIADAVRAKAGDRPADAVGQQRG